MGFGRFIIVKGITYFSVLMATVSILYLSTAGLIQKVLQGSAQSAANDYKQNLLKSPGAHYTTQQLTMLEASFKANYLRAFGFNVPPEERFFIQMGQLITFHFGDSYFLTWQGSHNVGIIISGFLPNTILLFTTATLILIFLGIVIGLLAAKASGGLLDRIVPFIAVIHSSLPAWWLGFLLIAELAYGLKWFPTGGQLSVPPPTEPLLRALNIGDHMVLPILALLIVNIGGFAYVVRSLVISTMGEDFVLTARARGISESRMLFRHVFRTASPAITTQSILAITGSFTGALITEIVFSWPGIGLLTYDAIFENDLPVIIGVTFVTTVILLLGLFLGELCYGVLDPRIRVAD